VYVKGGSKRDYLQEALRDLHIFKSGHPSACFRAVKFLQVADKILVQ
jgi:hypothetical protein